jgi:deoxyribodipyrimidine photo-lyase
LGEREVLLGALPPRAKGAVSTCIYWFRSDLRLHDHAGLRRALARATQLLPVYCHDAVGDLPGPWGFAPVGAHRRRFVADALADLRRHLQQLGSGLLEVRGRPRDVLPPLARAIGASAIVCEEIVTAGAQQEVAALREAGVVVEPVWMSSLLDPDRLPYWIADLPRHYTPFRQSVEKAAVAVPAPQPAPTRMPPLPPLPPMPPMPHPAPGDAALLVLPGDAAPDPANATDEPGPDARSAFPYHQPAFRGGESAALAHLDHYFAGSLAPAYKSTRNRLTGTDNSTKFSPWLATGALSARVVLRALRAYESAHGSSDGTYAIWFELLWRDFFRFLALRERARAKPHADAGVAAPVAPDAGADAALRKWREGRTGADLVDAGMRELAATGFLSNRLRQVVASFLIHDLHGDPRAGAAWFAAQLVDYDPYSNDGNWHYIAGTGADPRGGRHFNIEKQTRDHDPDGQYRVLWGLA